MKQKLIFHPIKSNKDKVTFLARLAKKCMENKAHLDIITVDETAAKQVYDLLWRYPSDSFTPHSLGQADNCYIAIHSINNLIPTAKKALNLTPYPLKTYPDYLIIYEIQDETSESKKLTSQSKYKVYKELGFSIAIS